MLVCWPYFAVVMISLLNCHELARVPSECYTSHLMILVKCQKMFLGVNNGRQVVKLHWLRLGRLLSCHVSPEDVQAHGHSPRRGRPRDRDQQEPTYNGTYMYDRAKPGRNSFSSENNSGTYCFPNINEAYYQQQFGPKWNPKPSKGILAQQGKCV